MYRKVVPLLASALGHHNTSGNGYRGVWFPTDHLTPRQGFHHRPLVWIYQCPKSIRDHLITTANSTGKITNSDLELAGGLLHLQEICQAFDIRKCTVLRKMDNLATLFWKQKGSATTEKCPHFLLHLCGIHQIFYQYVPRHE